MRVVLFFLSLLFVHNCIAQDDRPVSIGLIAKTGVLLTHRQTMAHLPQRRTNAFELEISKQDNSKSIWSSVFKYPSQGFSFMYQDFGNREVLGTSFTGYRFTKFPLYQSPLIGFIDFKLGTGISYITEKYDKHENKKNIAIGSHINGFVNFQVSWTKHFKRFYVGAGVDFSHLSNAKIKTPNQGLNTLTGFFTAGYNLEDKEMYTGPKFMPDSSVVIRKFNKWHFHVMVGIKQNLPGHSPSRNFGVFALQGLYKLKASRVWDAEFGLDLAYNEANRWINDVKPGPLSDALLIGGYAGLSLSIYKSEIYFGIGGYAFNPVDPAGWVYNRTGIRFLTNEKWNLLIGIKAHVGIADYLEWGVGYRF